MRQSPISCRLFLIFILAVSVIYLHTIYRSPLNTIYAEKENPLLFYASYDKNPIADVAFGEESPLANQNLKVVQEGRKGGALLLDSDSVISYDAPGNVYSERGTVSIWWRLDEPLDRIPFSIVRISKAQDSTPDFTFADLQWNGERLRLWFRDQESRVHSVLANEQGQVTAGRWYHLAFTWDELGGIHLYLDGREVASEKSEAFLFCSLDQVGIHTSVLSPRETRGNGRRAYIDELRLFGSALSEKSIQDLNQGGVGRAGAMPPVADTSPEFWKTHWRKRFGWDNAEAIPSIKSPSMVRQLPILEGTDARKFSISAFDGLPETYWPGEFPTYPDAGKTLELKLAEEPFNYMVLEGSLAGRIIPAKGQQKPLMERSASADPISRLILKTPQVTPFIQVQRQSGTLKKLSFFQVQVSPPEPASGSSASPPSSNRVSYRLLPRAQAAALPGVSRSQVSSLYGVDLRIARHYLPPDRESWVGVPNEVFQAPEASASATAGLHYLHVILPPLLQHTALDALKLRLNPGNQKLSEEAVVNIAIKDPVVPRRDLMNVDLRIPPAGPCSVVLDFQDIVLPAGTPLWLTIAGNQSDFAEKFLTGAEVEVWLAQTGVGERAVSSKREYLSQRLNMLRDDFQIASPTRFWAVSDQTKLRRQCRIVDELNNLVDDVLRTDSKESTALAYLRWTGRNEAPPDLKLREKPDRDVPLWAFQQLNLVSQFRQIVDWWVRNRQISSGEFGDGIPQDTSLAANWPGVELMEGPAEQIRASNRSLVEACYRQGALKNGINGSLAGPLDAYHQGIGILTAAALLDYGNPTCVERIMEATRQYERLTSVNKAQHRHFCSSLFSATDLMEEALYAKEDPHSALMWQPGLFLAWYNGNPILIRIMSEHADALLNHWQKQRYPQLTRGVRFFDDAPLGRGVPDPELVDFFWGIYRLTGNSKYLSLLDRMATMGDIGLAESISGRWLDSVEAEVYRNYVEEQVRKRTIWDRNLSGDESGLLARQFAYEVSGDKKLVEDYQAALLKHLVQNLGMYTEVQPATGSVRLLHRVLQRARLGGIAHYEGNVFPGLAVSWEGDRGNVAALVAHATPRGLKIVAFNMAKAFLDVNLRIWELENGTYEILEGTDLDGDDKADIVTTRRTLRLKRYSIIHLTLRPRRTTIIEINQVDKGTPLWDLPDLAIGPEDLQFDPVNEKGQLVIHNIGAKKSPNFILQVENERRVTLLKKELSGLDAPLDLRPKTVVVDLNGLHMLGSRTLIFKVNAEPAFEEITEDNNQLRKTF